DWSVTGVQTCALPIFQSLAGQGVKGEEFRPLGQRPAHDVGLGAGACPQRENGLRHLQSYRRRSRVRIELKAILGDAQQAVFGQRSEERRVGKERGSWR